jgi:hypothetical protein
MSTAQRLAVPAARSLHGLVFLVFGLNYFVPFLPQPPSMAGAQLTFITGLAASGYVLPLVKSIEVLAGVLLLSDRFVPLALTLLAPIVVAIVGFHLAVAPTGLALGLLVLALELGLAWAYRSAFVPMLRARVAPARLESASGHLQADAL